MREHNFYCLPEEPLKNACVANLSVAENLVLRRYDQSPFTFAKYFLNRRAIKKNAEALIKQYNIKTSGPAQEIGSLSGGNVQRAVLAREISQEISILIISNPCFGLDFKAVADIRGQIVLARNKGAAVLLLSEDLDEILELSDRITVISDGEFVYETDRNNIKLNEIGQYMAGH
jgi:simple sugar transport system ATP-binding protein